MFNQFQKPVIMGILNVTPDSFSDGGQYCHVDSAVAQASKMLHEGADIIDIGGESTRPGAKPVSVEEQISRVVPVIRSLQAAHDNKLCISIDTTQSEVAAAAIAAGAGIINDVSAAMDDPEMLPLAATLQVPIILMHRQGTSRTMQENPQYDDVTQDILSYLQERVDAAQQAGIARQNIALDPGIGFGKRKQDNIDLMANLQQFVVMGYPVLLGTSRKRFMGAICDVSAPQELVVATAVTTALGIMAGVQMFRVHDVKENRQAADVAWAIKQAEMSNV